MGTRSLTYVYDGDETIVCMYRQFDGYPTGHGAELAEFLEGGMIVNGLPMGQKGKFFNGMGDLAAQMVAYFKKGAGGFYLYPTQQNQDCWQEYEYHIWEDKIEIFETYGEGETIFAGSWNDFRKFCNQSEVEVNNATFDTKAGQDWLKSVLNEQVVTVTFLKSDGSERVMNCTTNEDYIKPNENGNKAYKGRKQPVAAQPVWDIDADAWRSFRWDSIKKVEIKIG
jgi:hypothetical protein